MHSRYTLPLVAVLAAAAASVTDVSAESPPIHEKIHTERAFEIRMIDAIRDFVPHAMDAHGTPGLNLALGYRGRIIWEAGFGYSDVASGKPMLPETIYHSGSLGKTYTATAIMHLVDRGVIRLEDRINRHLPFEVHNSKGDRDITVHDLMTHTSGLGSDGAISLWSKPRSLAVELKEEYEKEHFAIFGGTTVPVWEYKVGEQFSYSNVGLATLGLIVETANPDGLSFSEYVQKNVMDPLGMESSQFPPAQHVDFVRPEIWAAMSTGYTSMGSAWIPTLPVYFGAAPAGSVLARPADHVRLLMAMLNDGRFNDYQLLKPETVELMLSPKEVEGNPNQGLIWRVRDYGKPTFHFDHAGGHMFGWRTQGRAWPTYDAAIMVAINQWRLPEGATEVEMVSAFVGDWLAAQWPDVTLHAATEEWSWKVSYVRGALFAASYVTYVGLSAPLPEEAVEWSTTNTRLVPGRRDDWDPQAFRQGIQDISNAGLGLPSVREFWTSESCKVAWEDVKTIYTELNGTPAGFLSPLLPVEKPAGAEEQPK